MSDVFELEIRKLAPEPSPVPAKILEEIKARFHQRYPDLSPEDPDYAARVADVVLVYGVGVGRWEPVMSRGWHGEWPAAMEKLLRMILGFMASVDDWLFLQASVAGACLLKATSWESSRKIIAMDIRSDLIHRDSVPTSRPGRKTLTNWKRQMTRCARLHSLWAWLAQENRQSLASYLAQAVKGPLRSHADHRRGENAPGSPSAPGTVLQGRYAMYLAQNYDLKMVNVLVWTCGEHSDFKNLAYPGAVCRKCEKLARAQPQRFDTVRSNLSTTRWLMFFGADGNPPPGWSAWLCWRCQYCPDLYPKPDAMCRNGHRRTAGAAVTTTFMASPTMSETSGWRSIISERTELIALESTTPPMVDTNGNAVARSPARAGKGEALPMCSADEAEVAELLAENCPVATIAAHFKLTEAVFRARFEDVLAWSQAFRAKRGIQ